MLLELVSIAKHVQPPIVDVGMPRTKVVDGLPVLPSLSWKAAVFLAYRLIVPVPAPLVTVGIVDEVTKPPPTLSALIDARLTASPLVVPILIVPAVPRYTAFTSRTEIG